jgi:hypothetical protein
MLISYSILVFLYIIYIIGQVRRKEQLEGQLAALEADIGKLDRARSVLIH